MRNTTIQEKIRKIIEARGITQDKLAKKLGVTFVALNRWANGVSLPRKKNQIKIDKEYGILFGELTESERAFTPFKIESKKILERTDFLDNLQLKLTYHSNRLEGSTLTEEDTEGILFKGLTPTDNTLVEILEAKNHQSALLYVLGNLERKIDTKYILEIHQRLMNGIKGDAGRLRNFNVRIAGSFVPTANYLKVPEKLEFLLKDINRRSTKDIVEHLAYFHSKFEMIHPFSDGNGRVGRLLLIHLAMQEGYLPPIIDSDLRVRYLRAMQKSQLEDVFYDLEEVISLAFSLSYNLFD